MVLSDNTLRSDICPAEVAAVRKFLVGDALGSGGMYKGAFLAVLRHIHHYADMADHAARGAWAAEKHEIARPELIFGNRLTLAILHDGCAVELYTHLSEHKAGESGAVKGFGTGSTPSVAATEK